MSKPYIKFGRNQLINEKVRVSTNANREGVAIVAAILVIVHWRKIYSELGENRMKVIHLQAVTCDFQQCGILKSVVSDKPV